MNIVFDNAAPYSFRGPTPADADFELSSVVKDTLVSSSGSSNSTTLDRSITTYSGATYDRGHEVTITDVVPGTVVEGAALASLDTGVATISNGIVSRVSNGTARIQLATPRLTKQISLEVTRVTGSSSVQWTGYTTGTLAQHCSDAVDTRIAGLTPSVAKPIFSTFDHASPSYVRNTGCWIYGVDSTCISVWNSYAAAKFGPTAITPDAVIFANHAPIPNGTTIRFVTGTNPVTVVTRTTTTNPLQVGSNDLAIAKLSSALPGSITPCEVLPSTSFAKLPSIRSHYEVPAVAVNQSRQALVYDWHVGELANSLSFGRVPTDATRLGFNAQLVSGDSGMPVFAIINNKLVLAFIATGGYASMQGVDMIQSHSAINSALTTLGSAYQLTAATISGFTNFS